LTSSLGGIALHQGSAESPRCAPVRARQDARRNDRPTPNAPDVAAICTVNTIPACRDCGLDGAVSTGWVISSAAIANDLSVQYDTLSSRAGG